MDDANEWRLGFSSDADIVRLTNARIIIIIFYGREVLNIAEQM